MADNQNPTPAVGENAGQITPQNVGTASNIDYDKIQSMIDGRNQRNEDSILKSYFQQQGLSEDEMKTAITNFKTTKAENEKNKAADITNLQNQLTQAQAQVLEANINSEAFKQAVALGVDTKTIPYLTKLADFSGVTDDKGTINADKVKEALNKVLEDVPALKAVENNSVAGVTVGADSSNGSQPSGNLFGFNFSGVRKH